MVGLDCAAVYLFKTRLDSFEKWIMWGINVPPLPGLKRGQRFTSQSITDVFWGRTCADFCCETWQRRSRRGTATWQQHVQLQAWTDVHEGHATILILPLLFPYFVVLQAQISVLLAYMFQIDTNNLNKYKILFFYIIKSKTFISSL